MSNLSEERVLSIHHWTDTLFSFTTTRNRAFRFSSGQFIMLGMYIDARPLLRAYSIASAHYSDVLEFFSIKIPDGSLTSRLQQLKVGDIVTMSQKATGTLLLDSLLPGERLYLLATGTGLAPFASIIQDPETYERFEKVILVHGCRKIAELAYGERVIQNLAGNELVASAVRARLVYYPTVTREPFHHRGRLNDLIRSGRLFEDLGCFPFSAERDRIMLCGSPPMLQELEGMLEQRAFSEGSRSQPGHYVLERAFVEAG